MRLSMYSFPFLVESVIAPDCQEEKKREKITTTTTTENWRNEKEMS